ncbi:MAG: DNA replication/repair protein RecF [Candidatus Saccharimonadia bacterium]
MIQSVELTNFRSYTSNQFNFSPGVTLVVGPNASGKTNLLESLYVLAATKSFRTRDPELIQYNKDYFRIAAAVDGSEVALGYLIENGRHTKQISRNGVRQSLSAHIGTIQATLFEPSDLELVSSTPERRRRYLDFILCQTDSGYLKLISEYRRVLKQRNSLLGSFDTFRLKDEIFAWDVKLTELAAEVFVRRTTLLTYLNELIPPLYRDVAGETIEIDLRYKPSVSGHDYANLFMDELVKRLPSDLAAGFTTIGPHREDFKVMFKNNEITDIASRGETRTAVLVMKLAELSYCEERSDVRPILLLDDVFSELDSTRREYLTHKVGQYQTIITTTEADSLKDLAKDYDVINT